MENASSASPRASDRTNCGLLPAVVSLLLRTVAALLLAVLVLLEPLVQPLLCALALLTFATALFFRFIIADPAFPFLGMLAFSVLCVLLLALYYRLVRFLSCGN